MKTFKEYLNYVGGVRLGNPSDNITPITSLGDVPPKGQGGKDSRAVGLHANYTTKGVGTIKPMLKANRSTDKMKDQLKKLGKKIKSFRDKAFKKTMSTVKSPLFAGEDTKRIPRKKGQPAGSDKHSDLYTDENPKGTIKGLGFKDVATAKASVAKIKSSGRTHAHKIQAAIAMEQRARVMGK